MDHPDSTTVEVVKREFPEAKDKHLAAAPCELHPGAKIFLFTRHTDREAAHPYFVGRGVIASVDRRGIQLEGETFRRPWRDVPVPPRMSPGGICYAVEIIHETPKKSPIRRFIQWLSDPAVRFSK